MKYREFTENLIFYERIFTRLPHKKEFFIQKFWKKKPESSKIVNCYNSRSFWSILYSKIVLKTVDHELQWEIHFGAKFIILKWHILIGRKLFKCFFSFSKIQCDKVQDVKPEVLYKAESDSNHSDSVKSEASSTSSKPRGVDPNPPKPGYGRGRGRGRGRAALQEILWIINLAKSCTYYRGWL